MIASSLAPLATMAPPAVDVGVAEVIDLAGFLAYVRHERRLSINTQLAYRRDLCTFAAWASAGGLASPLAPTAAELGRFLAHLGERGLSACTINRALSTVRGYYRFLHLRGRVSARVLADVLQVEGPKGWSRLPSVLNHEQAQRLVQAPAAGDRYHLRDVALLETLYATGCRVSEVCDLMLIDLHLTERSAEVHGKGGKSRVVLLNRPAVEAIAVYIERLRPRMVRRWPESPYLFVGRAGGRLNRERLWQLVRLYAGRADLAGVHPHTLRHTLATVLMTGGSDLRVIGDLMGHANIGTTQRYAHVDAERMRDLHRRHHPLGSMPPAVETAVPDAA